MTSFPLNKNIIHTFQSMIVENAGDLVEAAAPRPPPSSSTVLAYGGCSEHGRRPFDPARGSRAPPPHVNPAPDSDPPLALSLSPPRLFFLFLFLFFFPFPFSPYLFRPRLEQTQLVSTLHFSLRFTPPFLLFLFPLFASTPPHPRLLLASPTIASRRSAAEETLAQQQATAAAWRPRRGPPQPPSPAPSASPPTRRGAPLTRRTAER